MTSPARGGRTDRTWINSLVSELEVVCTTAPPETYRTGMTNLGESSGRSWCDVSAIRITSRGMWWHDWKLTFQGEHVETVGQILRRLARLASEPPGPGLQPHASPTPAQDNPVSSRDADRPRCPRGPCRSPDEAAPRHQRGGRAERAAAARRSADGRRRDRALVPLLLPARGRAGHRGDARRDRAADEGRGHRAGEALVHAREALHAD